MPSDLPSLLNRFDDPPMTLRGILGGLGLLIALVLTVRHWPAVLAAAPYLLMSVLVLGPIVLFARRIAGRYAGGAKLAPAVRPMLLLYLGLALGLSLAGLLGFETISR